MKNYYDVLGVNQDASRSELESAYRLRAQLLHPDRHAGASPGVTAEAERAMKELNEAWAVLRDADSRRSYDESLFKASSRSHGRSDDSQREEPGADERPTPGEPPKSAPPSGSPDSASGRMQPQWPKVTLGLGALLLVVLLIALTGGGGANDGASERVEVRDAAAAPTVVTATSLPVTTVPTTTTAPQAITRFLADSSEFRPTDSLNFDTGSASVNGELYSQSIRLYTYSQAAGPVHVSFVLGRNYTRLQATAGVDDQATSDHRLRLELFADGSLVFRQDMAKGNAAAIDLPVTGVYSLRFVVTKLTSDASGANHGYGVFGDARVTQ